MPTYSKQKCPTLKLQLMKKYEVWMEGFAITGNMEKARKLGEYRAESFNEAVQMCIADEQSGKPRPYWVGATNRHPGKGHNWEVFGCRIFDNEKDARETFG